MSNREVYYDVPESALRAEDWERTPEDELRLSTVEPGDPMGDYFGSPEGRRVQEYMLAQEKAAARLGLDSVRAEVAVHSAVLETHEAAERLSGVVELSPLRKAEGLSARLGCNVYCKLENTRPPAYTFKDRGAYNKVASLSEHERAQGILAVSTGNHAQGVALAAGRFGVPATIVMPETTPSVKQRAVRGFGANIILAGQNYSEAYGYGMKPLSESEHPMAFVHPFNDEKVIAGQGTLGKEILEQQPDVTHMFVPIGGGGLISGIARYVKLVRPDVKIIGVEPSDSNCASEALLAGEPVELESVGAFADSLTVKQVGDLTYKLIEEYVDEVITVDETEIRQAMRTVAEDMRSIVEPSGAVGMAGLIQYAQAHGLENASLATICTGGNIAPEKFFELIS